MGISGRALGAGHYYNAGRVFEPFPGGRIKVRVTTDLQLYAWYRNYYFNSC
jgi:hypothetical protein